MNMQMMKIGALVIVVAVVGYIFMPGKADSAKTQAKTEQSNSIASQQVRSDSTPAKNRIHKRTSKKTKASRQEARIEPDTTLRKETNAGRRSGPPSKMYGGL